MDKDVKQLPSAIDDTLGGRMSLARDACALTIEDAAHMTGVHKDVWRAWENDRSDPGASHIDNVAASLDVSLLWLATGLGPGPHWPGPH